MGTEPHARSRPEWTERTYAELLCRASVLLAHGESLIAGASFISARQRAVAAADDAGADLVRLRCTASPELAGQRMSVRAGGPQHVWRPSRPYMRPG